MDIDELRRLLSTPEWTDLEFKRAAGQVPKNAYETVSAFANTAGGWLVFGVSEDGGAYEVSGIQDVDKVQNEFLTTIRSDEKLSVKIEADPRLMEVDGKYVLAVHIPEVSRRDKPVYLNKTITQSYIRRVGCDQKCSQDEIKRFLRDAPALPFDSETINLDPEHCFDPEAVAMFRRMYYVPHPEADTTLSDIEFLNEFGLVIERDRRLLPTRGAMLLFGTQADLSHVLPRPIVDCQWIDAEAGETPDQRWYDRFVAEHNIMQTWKRLWDAYQRHSEQPFSLDADTLQRADLPPDYITFREAVVNLLIHQDYADMARKASILFYRDRTILWNPGDAFVSTDEQLLESGAKEVRNPRIVGAFRRIGLSEDAGSGIRRIFGTWHNLGYVPPVIRLEKGGQSFELTLLREPLLSEEQIVFRAKYLLVNSRPIAHAQGTET